MYSFSRGNKIMDSIETISYKNFDININIDESPESPREWDNLGTMVCFHDRYRLGDGGDNYEDPTALLIDLNLKQIQIINKLKNREDDDYIYYADDLDNPHKELINMAQKSGIIILPLYLYDHSGITMNTTGFNCRWDSGQVGWIYITPEDIKKEYSVEVIDEKLKKKVTDLLRGEVKVYDQYLTGNIYGYSIDEPINDSCWGFFGDHKESGLLDEAKETIDYYLKGK